VRRQRFEGSTFGIHLFLEIQLTTARINVDGVEFDPQAPIAHHNLVADVEEDDDRRGEVVLKEDLGIWSTSNGLEKNGLVENK
jgi:hypothetical protein